MLHTARLQGTQVMRTRSRWTGHPRGNGEKTPPAAESPEGGAGGRVRPSSARNLDLQVNHEFAGICSCAVAASNIIMFRMTVFTFSLKFLLSFTQIISHIPDPDNGNKEGRELLLIKMIYAPF